MSVQYHMRAWNGSAFVDWVVNDSPDLTGEYYPGGSAGLTNITINKKVQSKVVNHIRPLNSIDGTVFHINAYDWLKSTRTSSDTDSATDPIAVPTTNVGLAIMRGTADGSTPRDYASLYWNETQGSFALGFTSSELTSFSSTKPLISGHLSIVEGDEDGYLAITNNAKSPATIGVIRVPNSEAMLGRNAANDADVYVIQVDSSDRVTVGAVGNSVYIPDHLRVDDYVVFNDPTTAAQSGLVRVSDTSDIVTSRNAANTDDLTVLRMASNNMTIGDVGVGTMNFNADSTFIFSKSGSNIVSIDEDPNGYIEFWLDITNPRLSQADQTTGNGQNMSITAQSSTDTGVYGGSLILQTGSADNADGYADVRTGSDTKVRIYGTAAPVVTDYTLNSASNPGSIVLFNDNLRFYDLGSGISALLSYDATTRDTGELLEIRGQDAATTGGELRLVSGDGPTADGNVSIYTGSVIKFLIDQNDTTTTYNANLDFDSTVTNPKIEHEYEAANNIGDDFEIKSQDGDVTGGRLLLGTGTGGTDPGDLVLQLGAVDAVTIRPDGYGEIIVNQPNIYFDSATSENSYGTDKVLISQQDDPTTDIIANEMWLSAQSASDGYGGDLVLSSGEGRTALTDDGDVVIRLGLTEVARFSAVDGYVTQQLSVDLVQIDGDLIVNGTTTTINSTVVDIADRVIHVNHSDGYDDSVPVNITGFSVHRGDVSGDPRDHAGVIWDETDSIWKLAYVEGGYDTNLVSTHGLLVEHIKANSSPTIAAGAFPTAGALRVLNNTLAVAARNNAATSDLNIVSTNALDQIIHGSTTVADQIFNVDTSGLFDFYINSILSARIGNDSSPYLSFGTTPAITGNIRVPQAEGIVTNVVVARDFTNTVDQNLLSLDGYSKVVHGDTNAAGHEIISKDGYAVDVIIGANTLYSATVEKNIFTQGLRRDVDIVTEAMTLTDADGYNYILLDSTAGAFTFTLPASPTQGDTYEIKTWNTTGSNNITIDGNSINIDGTGSVVLNQNYVSMIFTYVAAPYNQWMVS